MARRKRGDIVRKKLTKEINKLREKLQKEEETNQGMWDVYGSELCVADMIRREEEIRRKIKHLEDLIKIPEVDLGKKDLNTAKEMTVLDITYHDKTLESLREEIKKVENMKADTLKKLADLNEISEI